MSQPDSTAYQAGLNRYLWVSYVAVVALAASGLGALASQGGRTLLFVVAALLSQGALYLAPVAILAKASLFCLTRTGLVGRRWIYHTWLAATMGAVASTEFFLYLDGRVYAFFGFHINGFVLNLVTTPGGLESMGSTPSTVATTAAITLAFAGFQPVLWITLAKVRRPGWGRVLPDGRRLLATPSIAVLLAAFVTEKATFGVSHLQAHQGVVLAAEALPLYPPMTIRKLARRFGYTIAREPAQSMGAKGKMDYPRAPVTRSVNRRAPNILWLVSESLRWDMLDPEIMPHTWRLAEGATRFTRHYSGGNGTRMGIFAMFYGLYGPYWFSCLAERRPPVLMDLVQEAGYQIELRTSAHFTYPEFDKTVFARVPEGSLHEAEPGPAWERDRVHVDRLLDFIEHRDPGRPFFAFLFFESPHAPYSFPPDAVIRKPYLQDMNYATLDPEEVKGPMKNRYINSCHYLDIQFGRLFQHLQSSGLLGETVVIATGDHGEEFMENGRWGHNSAFTEQQIRVPLVLHVPGTEPGRVVDRLTSHLDLPATLFPLLGVTNDPEDLSLGHDLSGSGGRTSTVIADWSTICVITDDIKATFPMKGQAVFRQSVTGPDDRSLADADGALGAHSAVLGSVLSDLRRFHRTRR